MNDINETKQFYNAISDQTFLDWFNNPSLLPVLTKFVSELPINPLILDMGCGTGGESKRLIGLGAKVIGIDFSDKSLQYAIDNVPVGTFLNEDIRNMLKKINGYLKSNGIFLSFYPVGTFEGMQEIQIEDKAYHRYTRLLELEEWIKQVMQHGFQKYEINDYVNHHFRSVQFYK